MSPKGFLVVLPLLWGAAALAHYNHMPAWEAWLVMVAVAMTVITVVGLVISRFGREE